MLLASQPSRVAPSICSTPSPLNGFGAAPLGATAALAFGTTFGAAAEAITRPNKIQSSSARLFF